jgi:hypothetical protein
MLAGDLSSDLKGLTRPAGGMLLASTFLLALQAISKPRFMQNLILSEAKNLVFSID